MRVLLRSAFSHGHVITGDFGIIPNEDLKGILLKGPDYREQTSINWGYNIRLIFTAVEDYAKKWAKKESQEYECLQGWVQHVKQMVDLRLLTVSGRQQSPKGKEFGERMFKGTSREICVCTSR